MKQYTISALSAILALAIAAPLEKREAYTTTVIEDVTDIVDVYTTVYVSPGDPRLTLNQQVVAQTPSSAPVVSVTPVVSTSSVPNITPSSTSQAAIFAPQQKQVEAPATTTTPAPSITPQAVAQPKVEAVAPVAPVAPLVQAAEVHTSAPPASSSPPSSGSSSNSSPSGGSCGTVNGKCTAGDVTTFDGSGAAGACGYIDPDKTPDYVALAVGKLNLIFLPWKNRTM